MGDDLSVGAAGYAELAIRIHAVAATATDPETASELIGLAVRYERLTGLAAQMVDKYLPIVSVPPLWDAGSSQSASPKVSDADS